MQDPIDLWNTPQCDAWHRAVGLYITVVREQEVSGLEELDAWYRDALPAIIASRSPSYIMHEELVRVTRWKMKRGVWRQRNMLLVEGNTEEEVAAVSREAFSVAPDPRKPISLLSRLAGVGPATASGVMSAYTPTVYPFFDELVAKQIPGLGPVAFTAAYYARYADMLRLRAAELGEVCPHKSWTAQEMSQALWAHSGGKKAL